MLGSWEAFCWTKIQADSLDYSLSYKKLEWSFFRGKINYKFIKQKSVSLSTTLTRYSQDNSHSLIVSNKVYNPWYIYETAGCWRVGGEIVISRSRHTALWGQTGAGRSKQSARWAGLAILLSVYQLSTECVTIPLFPVFSFHTHL